MDKYSRYSNGRVVWTSNGPIRMSTSKQLPQSSFGCGTQVVAVLIVILIISGDKGIDFILSLINMIVKGF